MKILKFDTKETVLELNGVHIEVIPSHHLDAMHSLTNPKFILREDPDYVKQIAYNKKNYSSVYDLQFLQQNMFEIPVAFSKELKNMLAHCKELMEYQNGMIAINPKHTKLITSFAYCSGKR